MRLYLDASVLVPLVVKEPSSKVVTEWLDDRATAVKLVSEFGAAEVVSALSRQVRMRLLSIAEANDAITRFEAIRLRGLRRVEVTDADLRFASTYLRRFETQLRTPDALHLALTHRSGATLVTRDGGLARAAEMLGVPVVRVGGGDATEAIL